MTDRQKLLALIKGDKAMTKRLLNLAAEPPLGKPVHSDMAAVSAFMSTLTGHENERFAVAALDRRRRLIDLEVLTVGSDAFVVVDPRQILRWALTRERTASAIIVAHNHPSGDPEPSRQDIDITTRLSRACRAVGIPLLDHIVIGSPTSWVSLSARGHVPSSGEQPADWTS